MDGMVRTHVLLPRDLVAELDRRIGQRRRSRFIEEAVQEKLARERQREALTEAVGVLNPEDYPYWSTPEQTSEWVHALRRDADEATMRKVSPSDDSSSA